MGQSTQRPRPGTPPQLGGTLELLRELLAIERDRLQVARRIEEERKIVFPETSVILRDILKINAEIERREHMQQPTGFEDINIEWPDLG